jgi:hypothetical protein
MESEIKSLLETLENIYLTLIDGYCMPAWGIQKALNIESKLWHKLQNLEIIERFGHVSKPTYKWMARCPDIEMTTELLQDYPMFDRDKLFNINQKPNEMLAEKDKLFDWVIPVGNTGRKITSDFRLNIKGNAVYLGAPFLDTQYPHLDRKEINVAFLLNANEKSFLVINPPQGVPFFKFRGHKGKHNIHVSPTVSNKSLMELFVSTFKLNSGNNIYNFRLEAFQRISNMMLYNIVPEV